MMDCSDYAHYLIVKVQEQRLQRLTVPSYEHVQVRFALQFIVMWFILLSCALLPRKNQNQMLLAVTPTLQALRYPQESPMKRVWNEVQQFMEVIVLIGNLKDRLNLGSFKQMICTLPSQNPPTTMISAPMEATGTNMASSLQFKLMEQDSSSKEVVCSLERNSDFLLRILNRQYSCLRRMKNISSLMNLIDRIEFRPSKIDLNRNFYYFIGALLRKHFWIVNSPPSPSSLSYHTDFMLFRAG